MIEIIHVHIPQNRNEVPAVVFGVALDAGIVVVAAGHQGWMQSPLLFKPLADFNMASRATELARACSTNVAAGAVGRTLEFVMRLGHGSR